MKATGKSTSVSTLTRYWVGAVAAALIAVVAPAPAHAAPPATGSTFAVDDVAVNEGDSGTTNATFTVSLSTPVNAATSVKYGTASGTAMAGSDFTATAGTLSFAANQTSNTFTVQVTGDSIFEPTEAFTVNLSRPRGAKLGDKTGTGTITNDDAVPAFSVGDASVVEGNSGTTTAVFPVTLTSSGGAPLTVNYAAVGGTAGGNDFTATSGMLTFAPGDLSEPVSVPVTGDIFDEADETFTVSLSGPVGAIITDGEATGTIVDDDEAPRASISDTVAAEPADGAANDAIFVVSLSAPSQRSISFDYATTAGSAAEGDDYVGSTGTVNIPAGQTQAEVHVPLAYDNVSEVPNETFTVSMSNPVNVQLHDGTAQGTILDFDARPVISGNSVSVQEGNDGTATATVTVGLSIASSESISVDYATAAGSAAEGSDYAPASSTLTFPAGTRNQTVQVSVNGDAVDELDESFGLSLSNPVGGSAGTGDAGSVTVLDDDATPTLSVGDVTISEVGTGTAKAVFTLTMSGVSDRPVTASYSLENGTAVSGADYAGATGTVTVPAGSTTAMLEVTTYGDNRDETNENFYVQLSDFQNANGGKDRGTGTILDTDKSRSTTSIKVRKRASAMIVNGLQRKPRPGQRMLVKLLRRKGARWVLVTSKRPTLSSAKDVNGDGVKESTFKVRFRRPARGSIFKVVAKYRGDADNTASKAARKVTYR